MKIHNFSTEPGEVDRHRGVPPHEVLCEVNGASEFSPRNASRQGFLLRGLNTDPHRGWRRLLKPCCIIREYNSSCRRLALVGSHGLRSFPEGDRSAYGGWWNEGRQDSALRDAEA